MARTRGNLSKDRTAAQRALNELATKGQSLKSSYEKDKPGQRGLFNGFGLFSGNISNPARVAGIEAIQEVINLIDSNLKDAGISRESLTSNPTYPELRSHRNLYRTCANQLSGVILAQAKEIYDSYIIRSPQNHSALYDSLIAIVNPAEIGEAKTKICLDAYKALVETKPKQETKDESAKEAKAPSSPSAKTSSDVEQPKEVEDLAASLSLNM